MEYANVKEFRHYFRQYCVVEGIEITRKKNEKNRFTTICAVKGCKWRRIKAPLNHDGDQLFL
uniref:Transposase MuDR plant domain-containing protein n=1 Tax=Nelumbo nucifera TaxID=4432 RepID=A0A822ZRH2_NELNU|nr:TPA_asm: hypothetical protein HUJ06_017410 [Nelumbo nucifera]